MSIVYKLAIIFVIVLTSCSGPKEKTSETTAPPKSMLKEEASLNPMENKGVGPITSIELGEIDQELVKEGQALFSQMCTACHKVDKKFIGPSPAGVLKRRSPEWIMNMILNPEVMVKEDPLAKKLLVEYNMAPMANQGLTEEQARAVLEYFRTLE